MKRFYCENCERGFSETRIKRMSHARMFGVDDIYYDNYIEIKVCPYCGSEEIKENESIQDEWDN